jgi:protein phosphatase 2C-like protein
MTTRTMADPAPPASERRALSGSGTYAVPPATSVPVLDVAGRSHRGCTPGATEECYVVAKLGPAMRVCGTSLDGLPKGWREPTLSSTATLLLVADGAAGIDGEPAAVTVASRAVTDYVWQTLPWSAPRHHSAGAEFELRCAVHDSVARAFRAGRREAAASSPAGAAALGGLTLALVTWPRMWIVRDGTSACFLVRHGELTPIGGESLVTCELEAGDVVVLASDGLTDHLDADAIVSAVRGGAPAERACGRLVAAALARGATADLTVVVARVVGGGPRPRLVSIDPEANADTQPAPATEPPPGDPITSQDARDSFAGLDGQRDTLTSLESMLLDAEGPTTSE